ncbi:MAG: S-layer homology domain-containing protein [Monoglobaceae bacterium]
MFKKGMAGLLAAMCITGVCGYAAAADSDAEFLNDGGICIGGVIDGAKEGDAITIAVVRSSDSILDEERWTEEDGELIVFCREGSADRGGGYSFEFALEEGGLYKAYIACAGYPDLIERDIKYVNREKFSAAIADLKAAESADSIYGILESRAADLGLMEEIYSRADMTSVSEIIFNSLKELKNTDVDSAEGFLKSAAVIDLFNRGEIDDSDACKSFMDMEGVGVEKYFNAELSPYITKALTGRNMKSRSDYEKRLRDAVILGNIENNNGTGIIKEVLTTFGDYIGIEKSKISTSLVSAVANKSVFSSVEDLKRFIDKYEPESKPSGGGGGGGSRGGAATNVPVNAYEGTEVLTEPAEVIRESGFADMSEVPWAEKAVNVLRKMGVINGKSETLFCPNDYVTREEFTKMLVLAFEMNLVGEELPFTDVAYEDWSYPYIKTAYIAGITNGISDDMFGKNERITRQDVCVMLVRAAECTETSLKSGTAPRFNDEDRISAYAREAVEKISAAGIVSGDESGNFNPQSGATRAETAKMIYNTVCSVNTDERR